MGQQFYYHTLKTAHLILEHGTIRARHFSCLNDREEFSFGMRVLEKDFRRWHRPQDWYDEDRNRYELGIKRLRQPGAQLQSPYHPICFTMIDPINEARSHPQFLAYSHDGGVALELDLPDSLPDEPEKNPFSFVKNGHWSNEDYWRFGDNGPQLVRAVGSVRPVQGQLLKVHYHPNSILSNGAPRPSPGKLPTIAHDGQAAYALQIKRSAFEVEQEYRYVFDSRDPQANSNPFEWVGFFDQDGVVSSYVDVGYSTQGLPDKGWPIVAVTAGPGRIQERVCRDLRRLLESPAVLIQPLSCDRLRKNADACLDCWDTMLKSGDLPFSLVTPRRIGGLVRWLEDLRQAVGVVVSRSDPPSTLVESLGESFRLAATDPKLVDVLELLEQRCYFVRRSGLLLRRSDLPFVW